MVGLGAQDTLGEADEFVERFDLTLPMVWDETFQTWAELGVSLQPSSMLFTPEGQLVKKWLGSIPESEVLAIAAGAAEVDGPQTGSASFCRFADRYLSAHAAFESYADVPIDGQQLVLDDIRFASNAMSQTAPQDVFDDVEALASSNRALVALIVDSNMSIDPVDDATRTPLLEQRRAALESLLGPVRGGCGVTLPIS